MQNNGVQKGVNLDEYSFTFSITYTYNVSDVTICEMSGDSCIRCQSWGYLSGYITLSCISFAWEKILSMDAVDMKIDKAIAANVLA